MYFTNTVRGTIELTNFDGGMHKILIKDELDTPRSIALDPLNGWMYWSDWGVNSKIERAGMDGTHRQSIVTFDVKWPNGISLDLVKKRLYWVRDIEKILIGSCHIKKIYLRLMQN